MARLGARAGRADLQIRAKFGLDSRGQAQPYYLYSSGEVDLSPRGRHQTKWTFHVTEMPPVCKLAMEKPEDFETTVNGKPVGNPDGWWVDEDIKLIDISSLLSPGENEIVLSFDYRADMELESLYLVGDFGVGRRTPAAAARTT